MLPFIINIIIILLLIYYQKHKTVVWLSIFIVPIIIIIIDYRLDVGYFSYNLINYQLPKFSSISLFNLALLTHYSKKRIIHYFIFAFFSIFCYQYISFLTINLSYISLKFDFFFFATLIPTIIFSILLGIVFMKSNYIAEHIFKTKKENLN